jgi:LytR cell envelope-related transcriptional attenuator
LPEIVQEIGAYAGLASVVGLAVLSALYFSQARDVKRLREWAGRAPERAEQGPAVVPGRVGAQPQPPGAPAVPGGPKPGPPPVPGARPAAPAVPGGPRPAAPAVPGGPKPVAPSGAPLVPGGPRPAALPGAAAATASAAGTPAAATAAGARPAAATAQGSATEASESGPAAPGDEHGAGTGTAVEEPAAAPAAPGEAPSDSAAAPGDAPAGAPAGAAAAGAAAAANSKPATQAAGANAATRRGAPPVPGPRPAGPGGPRRPSQATAVIAPPKEPWYRRLVANPLYVVLAVAGVLIVGGAAAFGVTQLVGEDDSGGAPQGGGRVAEEPEGGAGGEDDARPRRRRGGAGVNPANITVAVLNGTTVPGLAATIMDQTEEAGFREGTVANFLPNQQLGESVVQYTPGHERDAAVVSRRLGIPQREAVNPSSQELAGDATVVVLVGADKAP